MTGRYSTFTVGRVFCGRDGRSWAFATGALNERISGYMKIALNYRDAQLCWISTEFRCVLEASNTARHKSICWGRRQAIRNQTK